MPSPETYWKECWDHERTQNYSKTHTGRIWSDPKGSGIGKYECKPLAGSYINSRNMQYVSWIAAHELGSKFDYHSLRHTHATILAEKGASPKYVQQRLGHKNIQVTIQIYQHLTDKMSAEGSSLLDTFWSAFWDSIWLTNGWQNVKKQQKCPLRNEAGIFKIQI